MTDKHILSEKLAPNQYGKSIPSLEDPLNFLKYWFEKNIINIVGAAGGVKQSLFSQAVLTGEVLMVFNIEASLYESASLAGMIHLIESTTAAIGGTDVIKDTIALDPAKAVGPLGVVAQYQAHSKGGAPLFIIDNKEGSSTIYFNAELPIVVGGALPADAATKNYSLSVNGIILPA